MTQQKKQWSAIIIMIALFAIDRIRDKSLFTNGYYCKERLRSKQCPCPNRKLW